MLKYTSKTFHHYLKPTSLLLKTTNNSYRFTSVLNMSTTNNPSGFVFNHTMLRVKDPQISLDFYTKHFGMKLLRKSDQEAGKFTLYFLGHLNEQEVVPSDSKQLQSFIANRAGILELTHNWGTETDDNFEGYHNGNKEPQGFGHIAFSVDDIQTACQKLEDQGVKFVKKLSEGRMRTIAFVSDPDGYWVELIPKSSYE